VARTARAARLERNAMSNAVAELVLILLLIGLNGLFALSEIAVVAARKQRLRQRAAEGDVRASRALDLAESPNRFLSTVQVGVTLISVVLGALGSSTLARMLASWIARVPFLAPYAQGAALAISLLAITYLSVVLGELVPKRLALNDPERVATAVAPLMRSFAALTAPVVRLLANSTRFIVRALGVSPQAEPPVTDEEIRLLFEEGTEAGVFEEAEQEMVQAVLLLGDRRVSAEMTPRPDVVWIDIHDTEEEVRRKLEETHYSRFPVAQDSLDTVIGEVRARDILTHLWAGRPFDLRAIMHQPLYVPEVMPVLRVLETFKRSGTQMAVVINEYGNAEGIVTLTDIMESIVGDIPSPDEAGEPQAVQRDDGSWLVDGMLPIDEFKEALDIEDTDLPAEQQGLYQTVAGFVILQFGRLPTATETLDWGHLRFEVLDMSGPRLNKVLVTVLPEGGEEPPPPPPLDED
jgi:putative hemolysin